MEIHKLKQLRKNIVQQQNNFHRLAETSISSTGFNEAPFFNRKGTLRSGQDSLVLQNGSIISTSCERPIVEVATTSLNQVPRFKSTQRQRLRDGNKKQLKKVHSIDAGNQFSSK